MDCRKFDYQQFILLLYTLFYLFLYLVANARTLRMDFTVKLETSGDQRFNLYIYQVSNQTVKQTHQC